MRSPKHMRTSPNIFSSADLPLPTLPFDVISEILARLPVKSLLQFRCVSKSWKSLISDPKFAKKHLNLSTTRRLLCVSYDNPSYSFILNSYSLQSVFTDTNYNLTRFKFPVDVISERYSHHLVGSCDGILCVANYRISPDFKPLVILWNPSIRKYKELPQFENPAELYRLWLRMTYGFGYDHVSHDYKLLVLYNSDIEHATRAKLYTLKADSWRTIQPFPSDFGTLLTYPRGRYVSGTVNWMTCQRSIVSFDLVNESYRKILPPRQQRKPRYLGLSVLRDWLCITYDHDVWVMKEYGILDSWTKLFNVTHLLNPLSNSFRLTNLLYIFQDDQVLLVFEHFLGRVSLIVYNFKNDTSKVSSMLKDISEVYVESLISPWS
ncbi:F-box/kelch-repeat protein At3g23880-like [Vicia villosa]|uniref:F-box/kelch-repeat protein At3g23880-like n=1 Tax=Vicia villosa TaxID=3911 RepID=UPI00273CCC64|nr:F-box/kelch-repeat protein At3g23880-like [Vicia villosa]XP_058767134.1 F-box/kelch-repeat protein At3g23880-like [Vicia villosa]